MKRVDPATFPEKFKKHHATPVRFAYVNTITSKTCIACALAIEAIDAAGLPAAMATVNDLDIDIAMSLAVLAGLTPEYARGLDCGWSGNDYYDCAPGERRDGILDGKAAYAACDLAGMFDD